MNILLISSMSTTDLNIRYKLAIHCIEAVDYNFNTNSIKLFKIEVRPRMLNAYLSFFIKLPKPNNLFNNNYDGPLLYSKLLNLI